MPTYKITHNIKFSQSLSFRLDRNLSPFKIRILEASLREESLRPDKPACRQAGGNDTTCAII
ncbi:MAG: hypothetical protein L0958_05340 [Candidatus Mariimomonas ferrooxydans]